VGDGSEIVVAATVSSTLFMIRLEEVMAGDVSDVKSTM
jgi:hypothetical protein